jgi:hypothetical protein
MPDITKINSSIQTDKSTRLERVTATMQLRLLTKRSTTTSPPALQQMFEIEVVDQSGRTLAGGQEWRDVPLVVED